MANGDSPGLVVYSIAGGLGLAAGLVLARLAFPREAPRLPAESPRPLPLSPPAAAPRPGPGGGVPAPSTLDATTAAFDRQLVQVLDQTLPGTAKSYDLLRYWVIQDRPQVERSLAAYRRAMTAWLQDKLRAGAIEADKARKAQEVIAGYDLAGDAVNTAAPVIDGIVQAAAGVPGVGSVIKGVFQVAQLFQAVAVEAAREGRPFISGPTVASGVPTFSGYRDRQFYYWDVPVWSLTAPMWVSTFKAASGGAPAWVPQLAGFEALATARPFGYPVDLVAVQSDGAYTYQFNLTGNSDVSEPARQRGEVRQFDVWNPLDVTPTGPRGFNPADPWGWKQPGMKKNKLDATLSRTGGL